MTQETKEYRGFNWHFETPDQVRDIIADYHQSRKRLRVWLGDTATGKPWLEEYDVIGYIGRSTGPKHIPLLINNRRSYGGGAISTGAIVALQDVVTKRFLYRHKGFKPPELVLQDISQENKHKDQPQWKFEVLRDGELIGRFAQALNAQRFISFMRGERMAK